MLSVAKSPYLVPFDASFSVADSRTSPPKGSPGKKECKDRLEDLVDDLSELQRVLYAHNKYAQGYSYRGVPLGHHAGPDSRNYFFELSRYFGPVWRASITLDMESRGRGEPQAEDRTEWGLALEAKKFHLFDWELEGRLDALYADVNAALDDPAREDRTEYYVGLGITATPWEPERSLR